MGENGDFRVFALCGQDATMTDISERDQPPGDPADRGDSWVRKVKGGNAGGMPSPERVLDDKFVAERMHLTFPDGEDGEPVITIGTEV